MSIILASGLLLVFAILFAPVTNSEISVTFTVSVASITSETSISSHTALAVIVYSPASTPVAVYDFPASTLSPITLSPAYTIYLYPASTWPSAASTEYVIELYASDVAVTPAGADAFSISTGPCGFSENTAISVICVPQLTAWFTFILTFLTFPLRLSLSSTLATMYWEPSFWSVDAPAGYSVTDATVLNVVSPNWISNPFAGYNSAWPFLNHTTTSSILEAAYDCPKSTSKYPGVLTPT